VKSKQKPELVIHLTDVQDLYGEQNLASTTLFAGGFINFGYWKNLKLEPKISKNTRALSSGKLYEKIFNLLDVNEKDTVLEVGCGLGNGCVMLHKKHNPKYIIGIDSSYKQIQRTHRKQRSYLVKNKDSIKFAVAEAENLQIPNGSISKIFSVEALQHFISLDCFLDSAFKAMKCGGSLVVTTFLFRSEPSQKFMDLFPNFASGVDKIIKLNDFLKKLKMHGFIDIKSRSIGKDVWPGFDKWISQTEYKDTWDKNWIQAYRDKIIDYYTVEAKKPI
ncbi:MAG: methyltransferase domain-containing protein, partial [Deltaproteobacteria bacterium]|nr:methyltransferase domain-containing protein [Deltaproteobacteria bacterium]